MPQTFFERPVIKVVVCGNRFVGKSSIISGWTTNKKHGRLMERKKLPQEHVDITRMEVNNDKESFYIDFYDSTGLSEPLHESNILSENTDFVLIVYDTTNNESWIDGTSFWLDWFENNSPNANVMLLGTKND